MYFKDTKTAFQHLSNWQVLRAYWLFNMIGSKGIQKVAFPFLKKVIQYKLPVKFIIAPVYNHFFSGDNLENSIQLIRNLAKRHVFTLLHYGAELKSTEADFEKTYARIMDSLEFAHHHLRVKIISCKVTGIGNASILEKIQKNENLSEDEKIAFEKLNNRINHICEKAAEYHIAVYWDAEESWIQDTIDELIENQMALYNKTVATVFNSYQMYRTDRLSYLEKSLQKAIDNNYKLGVKLVRGAYLEKENERAKQLQQDSPIYPTKADTDNAYNNAILFCIENISTIYFCVASHNEESTQHTLDLMQQNRLKNNNQHIWFSQLYGMSDHISNNLGNLFYNVAKYLPYGNYRDAIPYLMRRAEENSSSEDMICREIAILKTEIFRRSLTASIK